MSVTERQRKILHHLIREYIDRAEPISSELLKKKCGLDVSPATIRKELQELTEKGYVAQPHTSAGRVPTKKGYKFFIEITFSSNIEKIPDFIIREIEDTKLKIEKELQMARELARSLEEILSTLSVNKIEEDMMCDVLKIVGPARVSHKKNIDIMKELLEEFNKF